MPIILTETEIREVLGKSQRRLDRNLRLRLESALLFDERATGIRELAMERYSRGGDLEIEPDAIVSEGDDNGAYVLAWKWVDFEGTEFHKPRCQVHDDPKDCVDACEEQ